MDVAGIPLLSMLKERMAWLGTRQDTLTQNIANADTPGYAAQDVKPVDFEQVLHGVAPAFGSAGTLVTTNPGHIAVPRANDGFQDVPSPDIVPNPSGNSVSLEEEMIKVADTQAQYQAAANLYGKAIDMMKTAIGRTGG